MPSPPARSHFGRRRRSRSYEGRRGGGAAGAGGPRKARVELWRLSAIRRLMISATPPKARTGGRATTALVRNVSVMRSATAAPARSLDDPVVNMGCRSAVYQVDPLKLYVLWEKERRGPKQWEAGAEEHGREVDGDLID